MNIYKDSKTGRWYIDYRFNGRRFRYPAGDKKREVEPLASRITTEINLGTHDPDRTWREVRGLGGETMAFEKAVEISRGVQAARWDEQVLQATGGHLA